MRFDYSRTVEFLLDWYDMNARILPWRSEPQPYYVWVSEIMLQQTRVEAVKKYFERFIQELPDIPALAGATEDRLMKLWEGLGYYNRVRNMQAAAKIMMRDYQGELPRDVLQLKKLPGIGAYTAGAIASIAFGLVEPAVDGNVLRLMKRIAGSFDDITKETVKRELEDDIRNIMPKDRTADFTQCLMELGALVCIPNGRPLCEQCPLMHMCRAFHEGNIDRIPCKPEKKKRKIEERTVYLLEHSGKFAVRKRKNSGLLAGMWELPNELGEFELSQVSKEFPNGVIGRLKNAKHIFSHVEWHMRGYWIRVEEESILYEWKSPDEIRKHCAIPSAFESYYKLILDYEKGSSDFG